MTGRAKARGGTTLRHVERQMGRRDGRGEVKAHVDDLGGIEECSGEPSARADADEVDVASKYVP